MEQQSTQIVLLDPPKKRGRGGAQPGAGRPKGVFSKTSAEIAEYARQYGHEAIDGLVDLMRFGKLEATRGAAIRELLDRGYGRAHQSIAVTGADGGPIQIEESRDSIASRLASFAVSGETESVPGDPVSSGTESS